MYLGLDCSTQSLSALIIHTDSGEIVHESRVRFADDLPHYQTDHGFVRGTEPDEFFSDPLMWLEALDLLFARMKEAGVPLHKIRAISGSGQQHATVYLNESFHSKLSHLNPEYSLKEQLASSLSRPVSPIWLDASTLVECSEIAQAAGGDNAVDARTGSVITPRFSAAQIRKHAKQFPANWKATSVVHLVSSFMASVISGRSSAIDYGDGAGMNLMNLVTLRWDPYMAEATTWGLLGKLPPLAPSNQISGQISPYFVEKYGFAPDTQSVIWSGDNCCSLVGMGAARPSKWVISLGTSYTLFAAQRDRITDPLGYGHLFGNPAGGYMSLTCFKNGALACEALKQQLGISWQEFDRRALEIPTPEDTPDLPFFETEITPQSPALDQSQTTVRGLLDGQFLNMRELTHWHGEIPDTILVTGGLSVSAGVCQTIANVFQAKVARIGTSNSAALGAAIRAAHAQGCGFTELFELFCQPQGEAVLPQQETVITYNALAHKLTTKLHFQ